METDDHALTLSDPDATRRAVCSFLEDVVADAGADGVVVCLDGGVRSTVTARLAVEALGSDRVAGLLATTGASGDRHLGDARHVAEELVVDYRIVDLAPLLAAVGELTAGGDHELTSAGRGAASGSDDTGGSGDGPSREVVLDRASARLRAVACSVEADATNRLVAGSATRTDLLLGDRRYWADCFPLGDLYATQVRALARTMDVRDAVVETDRDDLHWNCAATGADDAWRDATTETLDAVLAGLAAGEASQALAQRVGCDPALVRAVAARSRTRDGRCSSPTPGSYEAATDGAGGPADRD